MVRPLRNPPFDAGDPAAAPRHLNPFASLSELSALLARRECTADLLAAVRLAVMEFRGAYAIAAISTREPGRVVGARQI
jgi:hypothetical protein